MKGYKSKERKVATLQTTIFARNAQWSKIRIGKRKCAFKESGNCLCSIRS
jgi:hypothetical protein